MHLLKNDVVCARDPLVGPTVGVSQKKQKKERNIPCGGTKISLFAQRKGKKAAQKKKKKKRKKRKCAKDVIPISPRLRVRADIFFERRRALRDVVRAFFDRPSGVHDRVKARFEGIRFQFKGGV